ncbi:hypothetical protein GQ54DRAFT_171941 [Martensiomyces pterosporus]|nr:hypothetical protein GQ54DRAFT_171941 [Martensiomyces pterosporus]
MLIHIIFCSRRKRSVCVLSWTLCEQMRSTVALHPHAVLFSKMAQCSAPLIGSLPKQAAKSAAAPGSLTPLLISCSSGHLAQFMLTGRVDVTYIH